MAEEKDILDELLADDEVAANTPAESQTEQTNDETAEPVVKPAQLPDGTKIIDDMGNYETKGDF